MQDSPNLRIRTIADAAEAIAGMREGDRSMRRDLEALETMAARAAEKIADAKEEASAFSAELRTAQEEITSLRRETVSLTEKLVLIKECTHAEAVQSHDAIYTRIQNIEKGVVEREVTLRMARWFVMTIIGAILVAIFGRVVVGFSDSGVTNKPTAVTRDASIPGGKPK